MFDIRLMIISLFAALLFSSHAEAYDETWGIFQLRTRLDGGQQILSEFVRRDRNAFFSDKNLDLYRISWGIKVSDWTFLAGGAYVDFKTGSAERRLHQFATYSFLDENFVAGGIRIGLEQRSFASDGSIYLRFRSRLQLNLFPQFPYGFSFYDEVFYMPNGQDKFSTGINENRLGLGLRFIKNDFDFYVFHTIANLKTPRASDRREWLQIFATISF